MKGLQAWKEAGLASGLFVTVQAGSSMITESD